MSVLISIIAVGILIAIHELGHMVAAQKMGMRVIRYSIGFFKALASWTSKKSGITYQVGAVPLGGFVQISGMNPLEPTARTDPESYLNKPVWRRALVLIAGPFANLFIAWLILFVLFASSGSPEVVNKSRLGALLPGGAAQKAGLKTGDEINSVNGKSVTTWNELVAQIEVNPGKEISLEVIREGSGFLVTLTTDANEEGKGKLGVYPPQETVSLPIHVAALGAAMKCVQVVSDTLAALGNIITGRDSSVQAVGPVGIVKMVAMDLHVGWTAFLARLAFLSLMLFLFNLLPLPALDGGRAVFLLYEAVTRKSVSARVDVIVNSTGFFLLIGLLLFMTVRDVISG
jgi:regulator of sigma E protease